MYVLDLETLVWRRVEEKGVWPAARYFHSLDRWGEGKLVLWGGMGMAEDGTGCVLGDLWVFDVRTGLWMELPGAGRARYAHLSAVVRDRLVIMGGQEITNE